MMNAPLPWTSRPVHFGMNLSPFSGSRPSHHNLLSHRALCISIDEVPQVDNAPEIAALELVLARIAKPKTALV
jgi:hypothetical protein